MDHHMLENGMKICNTDMGYKTGQMGHLTKGSFINIQTICTII